MRVSTDEYRELCKKYFRTMYDAGWSAGDAIPVCGCEDICRQVRENPNDGVGQAYSSYVSYRNQFVARPPQTPPPPPLQTLPPSPPPVNSDAQKPAAKCTSKDGVSPEDRLIATQNHTIIMLLHDIAESCRMMAGRVPLDEESEEV